MLQQHSAAAAIAAATPVHAQGRASAGTSRQPEAEAAPALGRRAASSTTFDQVPHSHDA